MEGRTQAPNVAYSYQIAGSQDPGNAAPVENWAVTGSTLRSGTLAARSTPSRTPSRRHPCGHDAGRTRSCPACCRSNWPWFRSPTGLVRIPPSGWVDGLVGLPGPKSRRHCADQQWAQNQQTPHLENVYKTLLKNNNKVLALSYYRTCPWSFGNWQPEGNVAKGPAAGNPCPRRSRRSRRCSNCPVKGSTTQYAQAMAVQDAMNAKIAAAVGEVQQWAKTQPGIDPADLQLAIPNQSAWEQHQAWSNDPGSSRTTPGYTRARPGTRSWPTR